MEWFNANKGVIVLVLQAVWAVLALLLKFYYDNGKNLQQAKDAALRLIAEKSKEVVSAEYMQTLVETISREVYEELLVGTFIANLVSADAFVDAVWLLWDKIAMAERVASRSLAGLGIIPVE